MYVLLFPSNGLRWTTQITCRLLTHLPRLNCHPTPPPPSRGHIYGAGHRPSDGWNDEDDRAGVTSYGVNHYESIKKIKVSMPKRPALMGPAALPLPEYTHENSLASSDIAFIHVLRPGDSIYLRIVEGP